MTREKVEEEIEYMLNKEPEKSVPGNFIYVDENGWGLCPVCHTKVLKVTTTTVLKDFPVYCKKCKTDHLVNWWNADNRKILYKKYVSDRSLNEQTLKGTGLRTFQNTMTSATERAAVRRA